MPVPRLSRRKFVGRAVFIGTAFVLLPYIYWKGEQDENGKVILASTTSSSLGFFNQDERIVLAYFSDLIFPGASEFGAVEYIENLLTAFDTNPPKIYAGGPFSGRHPFSEEGEPTQQFPQNSFLEFLPLTRIQEGLWRLKLYGSKGVPGGGPNDEIQGPMKGLREIIKYGLDQGIAVSSVPMQKMNLSAAHAMLQVTDKEFRDSLTELVLEACFSAPEYGGNKNLAGWKLIKFEGDTQPLGYSLYDESTKSYKERPDASISEFDPPDTEKDYELGMRAKLYLSAIVVASKVKIIK